MSELNPGDMQNKHPLASPPFVVDPTVGLLLAPGTFQGPTKGPWSSSTQRTTCQGTRPAEWGAQELGRTWRISFSPSKGYKGKAFSVVPSCSQGSNAGPGTCTNTSGTFPSFHSCFLLHPFNHPI